jgi:hypothetical protein
LEGVYRFLADFGDRLFPDDYFSDLYKRSTKGRPTVPARVLATVMILQSHEGLSDPEAVDRLVRDLAWQAACGAPVATVGFDPTVLVKTRIRLRKSERPKRLLQDTVAVARSSGVMSDRARVFDSTPVFDAVATQDTVTQLRAVIRKLLRLLDHSDPEMAAAVRSVLGRDDDYAQPGKPVCDWNDSDARDRLVDELVADVMAAVAVFDGEQAPVGVGEHLEFMVELCGQDVAEGDDGVFRIVKGVAKDRVISTVDRQARHGHKSSNRRFDGYKAHIVEDPDGEIIEDVTVTPANAPDAEPVADLVDQWQDRPHKPTLYGDAAYGGADTLEWFEDRGFGFVIKVPTPTRRNGRWSKADFGVDTDEATVTCPTGVTVAIRFRADRSGTAHFGHHCDECPLRSKCTTAEGGRTISIHRREDLLQTERWKQGTDPDWAADYTGTRPKVERKIGHMVRKPWGGRRARMRGAARIAGDIVVRAAAINLARLANIGLSHTEAGWQAIPP